MSNTEVKNVASLVPDKPKKDDSPDDLLNKCWTADEVRRFLQVAKEEGIQAEAFYTLDLGTGMRKGELCGLKWTDVDFKKNTVRVARTLQKPGPEPVFVSTFIIVYSHDRGLI
ncbi:MAG: tyrosine-type recombinase/integrase [Limnochordia bacterium]|nr:tyrosine-type recombinase/integrase [Limnochordia bacterium]